MKSFRFSLVLFVLFLLNLVVACSNEDDKEAVNNPVSKAALVTEIKGPSTGKVNVELNYDVTYLVDNACGEFDKISDVTIGAAKGLQVVAKYPSEVCTQQVPDPKKTVYKFKSTTKGTFEIKFKKSETEFITQKVVIE